VEGKRPLGGLGAVLWGGAPLQVGAIFFGDGKDARLGSARPQRSSNTWLAAGVVIQAWRAGERAGDVGMPAGAADDLADSRSARLRVSPVRPAEG